MFQQQALDNQLWIEVTYVMPHMIQLAKCAVHFNYTQRNLLIPYCYAMTWWCEYIVGYMPSLRIVV